MTEPEYITVIEGPTPEFRETPQYWSQSIQEGPTAKQVAFCELRTANGYDIMARCQRAWREGRPVRLDFPDEIRMRQEIDVVAMRLQEVSEGTVLMLWVQEPVDLVEEEDDEFDDDLDF